MRRWWRQQKRPRVKEDVHTTPPRFLEEARALSKIASETRPGALDAIQILINSFLEEQTQAIVILNEILQTPVPIGIVEMKRRNVQEEFLSQCKSYRELCREILEY